MTSWIKTPVCGGALWGILAFYALTLTPCTFLKRFVDQKDREFTRQIRKWVVSLVIPNFVTKPLFLLALVLMAVGCKPDLLPSTNLKDSGENRALVDFMLKYKGAIENRDADALMTLVSKDYFEDNGNMLQEDDYGYDGLREKLVSRFEHIKSSRLDLFIQNAQEIDEKVYVDYRYQLRSLITLPAGESWVSHTDVNRLTLRKKGDDYRDGFEVVSGL
tara:strand:- start:142 stop:795 length:654 start_codon:yes stop_codon:yes gene_type:complete